MVLYFSQTKMKGWEDSRFQTTHLFTLFGRPAQALDLSENPLGQVGGGPSVVKKDAILRECGGDCLVKG